MKTKRRILVLLMSLSIFFTSCSDFPIPTNANAAFENFTLNLFKQDVVSTTLGLHYTLEHPEEYGIENYEITLGSFDTDYSKSMSSLENCRALLEKFSYKTLSKKNQLTYDVLNSYINTSLEGAPYTLYEEPLSPITGIHSQLPVLLAEYAFTTEKDVKVYLELLRTVPDYFNSIIAFEEAKAEKGLFMSESSADEVIAQCNAFIEMGEENYLLSTFEERLQELPITKDTQNSYISQNLQFLNSAVIPAYAKLSESLIQLKTESNNDQGLCYLPGGKAYYSYLAARETGSNRTIEEIVDLTEGQISGDWLAMQEVIVSTPELLEASSTKTSVSPDVILENLESQISNAFPEPQDVSVKIKYVPAALEDYLSPAFYLIPSIDNTSENVIYINQAHALEDIHLFTTLAHEGYPGHLYQTTYYASQNPDPLRQLFNFKGYVEGWATYAEMCSYYLSNLEKPYATLLQKNSSLILGLYAMADIGIHYYGWNVERTCQFFFEYGIDDAETIADIYDLIIGDPANYLSYYVGYLEILELKQDVIERDGENFSQKQFHKNLLDVGPAPFEIVRKQLMGT